MSISTQLLKPSACAGEIWEHYSIPAFDESRRPVFEPADGIKSNKYVIDNNCILISKLNPSTKRLWLPFCTSERPVCSTEFIVYKPKKPEHKSFYYAAVDSAAFTDFLLAHVTGSTGSRQRTQPKATLNYPTPNPSVEEIEDFCGFADPIIAKWQLNEQESAQLESLRDALLPKLMSGEIDVSEVELPMQPNNHLYESKTGGCRGHPLFRRCKLHGPLWSLGWIYHLSNTGEQLIARRGSNQIIRFASDRSSRDLLYRIQGHS